MIAEAMVGNADGALDYYLRINPSAREAISEVHRCEPYVYAQMIAGPRRPDPRRGQELVADRHGGLELRRGHPVDPGHPARARGSADRPRPAGGVGRLPRHAALPRGDLPDRRLPGRPAPRDRSVTRLVVDGRPIEGNLAPLPSGRGAEIRVEAYLEAPARVSS